MDVAALSKRTVAAQGAIDTDVFSWKDARRFDSADGSDRPDGTIGRDDIRNCRLDDWVDLNDFSLSFGGGFKGVIHS